LVGVSWRRVGGVYTGLTSVVDVALPRRAWADAGKAIGVAFAQLGGEVRRSAHRAYGRPGRLWCRGGDPSHGRLPHPVRGRLVRRDAVCPRRLDLLELLLELLYLLLHDLLEQRELLSDLLQLRLLLQDLAELGEHLNDRVLLHDQRIHLLLLLGLLLDLLENLLENRVLLHNLLELLVDLLDLLKNGMLLQELLQLLQLLEHAVLRPELLA
jgi:hypothetical protein